MSMKGMCQAAPPYGRQNMQLRFDRIAESEKAMDHLQELQTWKVIWMKTDL